MSKTRLWAIIAALALVIGSLGLASCGDDDDEGGGPGTDTAASGAEELELIKPGTLTIGTDTPFPPFEIGQPPDITGYDIEVVDEIAKRLGLKADYNDTAFDTIFRDLAQNKFDLVVAASTITDERENAVDFSDPYYEAQQALLVTPGGDIKTTADLGGATVGAQDGTTGETYANDETDASSVRGFPEGPDAINALKAGQVDAVIIDEPVAKDAVTKGGDVEIVETISTAELYGLAMQEDSDALEEQVDAALTEMKSDGTLERLYKKYFPGVKPPASVIDGTHEPT